MPAIQPVVVTDRKATPVNYTLNPVSKEGDVVVVAAADASGSPITEIRLSASTRRTPTRVRSTLKFRVPIVSTQTVNGVTTPIVLREGFADVTFNFAKDHTKAERNDVVGIVHSALMSNKILINNAVVEGESYF